jgi:hypothetical protein
MFDCLLHVWFVAAGGVLRVKKRSVVQGGVLVTTPQAASGPAAAVGTATANVSNMYSTGAAATEQPSQSADEAAHVEAAAQVLEETGIAPHEQQYEPAGGPELPVGAEEQEGAQAVAEPIDSSQPVAVSSSFAEFRGTEIRLGTVAVIAAFGSGSSVVLDGCQVGGTTNYGIMASHGAQVELVANCDVHGASVAGAVVSSGAQLRAASSLLGGHLIGVLVERRGFADILECKLLSEVAGSADVPLPPAPKPGFLPSPYITPAVAEVKGNGSLLKAVDCVFGRDGQAQGRSAAGGIFLREDGVAAATA